MGKKRIIFYCIFGSYQLMAFIFTIIIDSNALILFRVASYVTSFKYLSFLGVVLIAVDVIWSWRMNSKMKKELDEFRHENNTLKAKIYDFQQSSKQTVPAAGSK